MKNMKIDFKMLEAPQQNTKRMLHFYTTDPTTAIYRHMANMIETYGTNRIVEVIRDMIEAGDFNGTD